MRLLTLLVLPLELLDEVVDETVVEVLTTKVSVTGGGLDLEDTLLDGQKGHIEGSSTEIEDEDVPLALGLLVETVGNGGGGRLVDDTKDGKTGDSTGVLGGLTLGVVEVCQFDEHLVRRVLAMNVHAGTVTTAWVTFLPR